MNDTSRVLSAPPGLPLPTCRLFLERFAATSAPLRGMRGLAVLGAVLNEPTIAARVAIKRARGAALRVCFDGEGAGRARVYLTADVRRGGIVLSWRLREWPTELTAMLQALKLYPGVALKDKGADGTPRREEARDLLIHGKADVSDGKLARALASTLRLVADTERRRAPRHARTIPGHGGDGMAGMSGMIPSSGEEGQETQVNRTDRVRVALASANDDSEAVALVRGEQRKLRQALLDGRPTGQCAICGRELPSRLLVAAHIWPRWKCSPIGRQDPYNVTLMCALGCDALFERGFIAGEDGRVVVGHATAASAQLDDTVKTLLGRQILDYSADSEDFYRRKRTGGDIDE